MQGLESGLIFGGTTAATAGLLTLATPLAPLAIASLAISAGAAMAAAFGKKQELEIRKKQIEIRAEQDALKRDEKMERIISQQNIMAAAEGVTPGSFAAIEKESFDEFAEDKRIADLNLMIQKQGIEQTQSSLFPQAFLSSLGETAKTLYYSQGLGNLTKTKDDIGGDF